MKVLPLLFFATLSMVFGQEQPSTPAAPALARPVLPSPEALRMAGFPVGVLKFEPALSAAFELTSEQAQELKKTWDETVEQAKKDTEQGGDQKQAQSAIQKARKDFESRRAMILTDQQISLLETIKETAKEAHLQVKETKAPPATVGKIFLEKMKVALTADQLALVQAAGGKVP